MTEEPTADRADAWNEDGGPLKRDVLQGMLDNGLCMFLESDLEDQDLSYMALHNVDLSWSCLAGANLKRSLLTDAIIVYSNLQNACCAGVNFAGACLSHSSLKGADLRNADLSHANLTECVLDGADLTGAKLYQANLEGASLKGIIGKTILTFDGPQHFAYACDEHVKIGCECRTVDWWVKYGVRIGRNYQYEPDEVQQYMDWIREVKDAYDTK